MATFLALAQDALDMTFGLTDQPKLFQKFGLTKDTVVLFKKVGQGQGGGRGSGPWLLLTPAESSSLTRAGQTSQWTKSWAWIRATCRTSSSRTACVWSRNSTAR